MKPKPPNSFLTHKFLMKGFLFFSKDPYQNQAQILSRYLQRSSWSSKQLIV
ncbi:hypothetical protein IC582_027329 [Cucumis melo]